MFCLFSLFGGIDQRVLLLAWAWVLLSSSGFSQRGGTSCPDLGFFVKSLLDKMLLARFDVSDLFQKRPSWKGAAVAGPFCLLKTKIEAGERCKGVYCVDLGEKFLFLLFFPFSLLFFLLFFFPFFKDRTAPRRRRLSRRVISGKGLKQKSEFFA